MGLRAASRSNVASDLGHRQNKVKVHVVMYVQLGQFGIPTCTYVSFKEDSKPSK